MRECFFPCPSAKVHAFAGEGVHLNGPRVSSSGRSPTSLEGSCLIRQSSGRLSFFDIGDSRLKTACSISICGEILRSNLNCSIASFSFPHFQRISA